MRSEDGGLTEQEDQAISAWLGLHSFRIAHSLDKIDSEDPDTAAFVSALMKCPDLPVGTKIWRGIRAKASGASPTSFYRHCRPEALEYVLSRRDSLEVTLELHESWTMERRWGEYYAAEESEPSPFVGLVLEAIVECQAKR